MTVVNFDFADPAGVPVKGYVSLVPTRRVTVGDEVRLPTALRVRLEAGEASVELMPSTTQWVWRVAELVPGGITRYVAVPDSELAVEYADLESVDPSSLDVSSASVPAWEIATRTAQETLDKVGEIDGKVERAEDAAAGAESSASEAEAHENAAKSSADAAASSASDAASNATAAASSAVSAASSASAAESSASGAASSAGEADESAEAAAGSATAAALSASDAAAHAESAGSSSDAAAVSAASAADSVSAASSYATSASQSASEAAKSVADVAGSVSVAASHANAAAQSASEASASAQAAKASETNAVSSASAAKASETNAAASATAAQQAVEGFGLEVGTTTTGEPGTDAAVEIQKTGTKYTASFTIPRGDVGPAGVNENVPLGTESGIVAQAKDAYPALPRKVQVHGRTVENHTVEPTKLTVLGENILDLSFINGHADSNISGDEIVFKIYVDRLNDSYTWNDVASNPYTGDKKYLIPVVPNSRLHFKAETSEPIDSSSILAFYGSAYNRVGNFMPSNVSGNIQSLDLDVPSGAAFISVRLGVKNAEADATITMRNVCLSYTDIEYVAPEKIETNLPSDISLADGDTLTIDRDGTTQIIHAEGEPTVLENVTLPELPAPTFNVYTTGGYIPPTVEVDYEQDVSLVIANLEAKLEARIASLEVTKTIMQGA